jgi:hypothetical protein
LLACASIETKRTTANPIKGSQATQPPLAGHEFRPRSQACRKDSPNLRSDECGEF